jgi:hypothetical protein
VVVEEFLNCIPFVTAANTLIRLLVCISIKLVGIIIKLDDESEKAAS